MSEAAFIESIDGCFPYHDEARWKRLIDEGVRISPNAAFMIYHELVRVPQSVNVGENVLVCILDYLDRKLRHPAKEQISAVCRLLIQGRRLSLEEAIEGIRSMAEYTGAYDLLNIFYFSCEHDEEIDREYQKVVDEWKCLRGKQ
ncbi:MAG: hypothetical protein GXP38_00405 [Chloroflexi bacterium]|nr:hypothetical protein [Chloroflexota bacterium]